MTMLVMNRSRPNVRMTPSCGQNIWPATANLRSTTLTSRSGLPLMRTKGPTNMMARSTQLTYVRHRYHRAADLPG